MGERAKHTLILRLLQVAHPVRTLVCFWIAPRVVDNALGVSDDDGEADMVQYLVEDGFVSEACGGERSGKMEESEKTRTFSHSAPHSRTTKPPVSDRCVDPVVWLYRESLFVNLVIYSVRQIRPPMGAREFRLLRRHVPRPCYLTSDTETCLAMPRITQSQHMPAVPSHGVNLMGLFAQPSESVATEPSLCSLDTSSSAFNRSSTKPLHDHV